MSWAGVRLALGYVVVSMLGVAAVALFLSTLTTSSIGAALGTVGVLIVDCPAGPGRRHSSPSVSANALLAGLCRPVPRPDSVARCAAWAAVQLSYLLVFTLAAWASFSTKDITD